VTHTQVSCARKWQQKRAPNRAAFYLAHVSGTSFCYKKFVMSYRIGVLTRAPLIRSTGAPHMT